MRDRRIRARWDGGTQDGDAEASLNPGLNKHLAHMIRRSRNRERGVSPASVLAILSSYPSARRLDQRFGKRFDHLTYRD